MAIKTLSTRQVDWVTAPGDDYTLMKCPPPPDCSSALYTSSLWIVTHLSVTVEESATVTRDPDAVQPDEKLRYEAWSSQAIRQEMGCDVMEAAEAGYSFKFTGADVTLSANGVKIMSKAFALRADKVIAAAAAASSGGGATSS